MELLLFAKTMLKKLIDFLTRMVNDHVNLARILESQLVSGYINSSEQLYIYVTLLLKNIFVN